MEIVAIIILILVAVYLGKAVLSAHERRMELEKSHLIDRTSLIKNHLAATDDLREKFEEERKVLIDKLLVRNGVSPVYKEKEEPKPFTIKSTLTKNAEIKEKNRGRK